MEWLIFIVIFMVFVIFLIFILNYDEKENQYDREKIKESTRDNRKQSADDKNDIHIQVVYDRDIRNNTVPKAKGHIEITTWLGFIPVVLLFYAPAHTGAYGFYTALRIIVCVVSIYRIYGLYDSKSKNTWIALIYAAAIVLFQPFWSWGIERESWAWIDVLYGIIFLIYSIRSIVRDLKAK